MPRPNKVTFVSAMASALACPTVSAFSSVTSSMRMSVSIEPPRRAVFDPLGLYPKDCPERKYNMIQPLEATMENKKPVMDPMRLYPKTAQSDAVFPVSMSVSIPFLARPEVLEVELPGDVGFDPFGFAPSKEKLMEMREAELKHARLAMLATVGWVWSELLNTKLAGLLNLPEVVDQGGRVPAVLNGGLGNVSPIFWCSAIALASGIEIYYNARQNALQSGSTEVVGLSSVGDHGFDPFGVYRSLSDDRKRRMQLSEIRNGRLAMVAITLFAVEEFITKTGVVHSVLF